MKIAAAVGVLLLSIAAAPADPVPAQVSGTTTPCGTYELGRAAPPRHEGNITYETIEVTFAFADGHHELAVFPYPWVYNDRSDRNPFARANAPGSVDVFPLRMPPKGADTSAYQPAMRFLLAHMTSGGYGTLPNCPAYGSPTTWPDAAGIHFVDASAPDSPVEIIDPRDYALGCIAFRNRSARTLSVVHFTLTQVDIAGRSKPPDRLDRFGSFAPGVLIAGIPRGMSWGRTSNNMLRNCRWNFSWSPDFPVIRIDVTSAEFADGSTWLPASRAPVPGSR